jgi:hypothetical protein
MTFPDKALGKKLWAFSAGHMPLHSTGKEPEFTSHDKISVLNTSHKTAEVKITIFYEDSAAVKDHTIAIRGRRVRKIRFNDLINPLPIPLDKPFAFVVTSDVEIIVQFSRMDTSSARHAGFCVTPFFNH